LSLSQALVGREYTFSAAKSFRGGKIL